MNMMAELKALVETAHDASTRSSAEADARHHAELLTEAKGLIEDGLPKLDEALRSAAEKGQTSICLAKLEGGYPNWPALIAVPQNRFLRTDVAYYRDDRITVLKVVMQALQDRCAELGVRTEFARDTNPWGEFVPVTEYLNDTRSGTPRSEPIQLWAHWGDQKGPR